MVAGREGVLRANCLLLDVALDTVSDASPLLVAVTVSVLLLPTTTLPKFSVAVLSARLPLAGFGSGLLEDPPPALKPWHPARVRSARKIRSRPDWGSCRGKRRFLIVRGE